MQKIFLWKKNKWFWMIFITGLLLRILLNNAADSLDFYAFVVWAKYLTTHRISDILEFLPGGYPPYTPIYYYVLWFLGRVISILGIWENKWLTYFIIRLPVFAGDIGVLGFVYWFGCKYISEKAALWGGAFYFLHPVIIYNTSVWGQIDSFIIFLGWTCLYFFISGNYFWAIGFYAVNTLTKLQSLAILPLIGYLSLVKIEFKRMLFILCIWSLFAALPFLPVVLAKGVKWTWDYFFNIPNWYPYTSVYAYNLWAPFGFIVSDNTKLFGAVAYKYVGIALFWSVAIFILKPLFNPKLRQPVIFIFAAYLLWFDFAFFLTRIHSRYLIYTFGFFAPFFLKFPKSGLLLSLLMAANFLLPNKSHYLAPLVTWLNQPPTIYIIVSLAFSIFLLNIRNYVSLLNSVKTKRVERV